MKTLSMLAATLIPLYSTELPKQNPPVIVHEWGTFTSIATETGAPARWAPLSGDSDLPCFVERLGPSGFKDIASGFVRMETPVLYFYSQAPVTLSVRVGFPEGWITEWYPNATHTKPDRAGSVVPGRYRDGEIVWDQVHVVPGARPALPVSKGASHYFAARETDAAPVRIGDQWEKLIFYRGVAEFAVPLRPVIAGDRVKVTNAGQEAIPLLILFENRGGKVGYRLTADVRTEAELQFPELDRGIDDLRTSLASHLVEFGLYRKEAEAMVETWRDSWFEQGMRLFYIVPRAMVDRVLPLNVAPAPSAVARVFVGRVEILSPASKDRIRSLSASGDTDALRKLGRFLGPFVTQMERTEPGHARPAPIQSVFSRPVAAQACVQ